MNKKMNVKTQKFIRFMRAHLNLKEKYALFV